MTTPPRRRFRFSLRTLLLATLMLASAATLWWNWGPWRMAYIIDEPDPIRDALFSDDGQFVLVNYDDLRGLTSEKVCNCLDVRMTVDGNRHALLSAQQGENGSFRQCGNYVFLHGRLYYPNPVVFDLQTGAALDSKGAFTAEYKNYGESSQLGKNSLLYYFNDGTDPGRIRLRLARLPGFETIRDFPLETCSLYASGKWVFHSEETVQVVNPETGAETVRAALRMKACGFLYKDYFCWSPDYILKLVNIRTGVSVTHIKDAVLCDMSHDGKRIWVREGEQTALYDFAPKLENPIVRLPVNFIHPSEDEAILFGESLSDENKTYDGRTFRLLWENKDFSCEHFDTRNKLLAGKFYEALDRTCILDARNGNMLMDFSSWRWQKYGLANAELRLSPDARTLIAYPAKSVKAPAPRQVFVFRLHRPWDWFGPAYLSEFWLTLVLAAAFLWSIFRDRRPGKSA